MPAKRPRDSKKPHASEVDRPGSGPEPATGRRGPLHEGAARGGALTGETGALTEEAEGDDSGVFVPAETAEVSDPLRRGHMTEAGKTASLPHRRRLEVEDESATEGGEAPLARAGQLATERASGLTGLQAQNSAMGASTTAEAGLVQGAGATELAQRESGYGGGRGPSPTDPAYAMDDTTAGEESPDNP